MSKSEQKTKDVAKQQGGAVAIPGGIDIGRAAQAAKSETIEIADQALPFIKVTQGLSPEITEPGGKAMYPGLEIGDFFDTATGYIWKGKDGIVFVPNYYQRTYVKWRPRNVGGGFVADLGLEAGKAILPKLTKMKPEDAFPTKFVENGETFQIIETTYWAGFVVDPSGEKPPLRAILAMSSSFLKPSRNWNTAVMNFRIPGVETYIRWARPFRLTTESTKNEKGTWSKPVIVPYVPEDHDAEKDGPFYTWLLPEGEAIWNACQAFADDLQRDGLRPTPPENDMGEATEADNTAEGTDGDELY